MGICILFTEELNSFSTAWLFLKHEIIRFGFSDLLMPDMSDNLVDVTIL